jgi:hypothetical protein
MPRKKRGSQPHADRQSIAAKPKGGRPAIGHDPVIGLRMSLDAITSVDKWAKRNECTRSAAIRRLIWLGLKSKTPK